MCVTTARATSPAPPPSDRKNCMTRHREILLHCFMELSFQVIWERDIAGERALDQEPSCSHTRTVRKNKRK